MATQRIEWIDRLKGILILLVVLGHVVGMRVHCCTGFERDVMAFLYKFIYLFHMPAFFFVAGLTYKEIAVGEFIRGRSLRLLMPYFSFGIVSIVIYQLFVGRFMADQLGVAYYNTIASTWTSSWWHPWGSLLYGAPLPATDGFRCNSVLWFLPCYFTVVSLFILIAKWGNAVELIVAVLSIPAFVMMRRWQLPELPWGLSNVFRFLPFVIVGHLLSSRLKDDDKRVEMGLMVILGLYILASPLLPFHWGVYTSYWQWPLVVLAGLMGTLGTVAVAKLARGQMLVWMGGASMGVMMIHKWFVIGLDRIAHGSAILVFLMAVVASCLSVVCVRKICPWMLGERRRP